ncbi:MFS transporter [Filobacillus milosensis]|uniref:MFS transporter n=1 Tax=Filobacillus milosensis TaxID=94137 RepID=A0A4Y8IQG6_9BACI|nr:MFS transporter [Filobacillus milosensis]TFB22770.1 MFS transporter [Filobacillus milosensis]
MKNWHIWLQEKEYQKLFWSGVVNGVGNRFTQVALLALIYQMTESGFAIGLLFLIRLLPFLIMAPIGGRLADRLSKKYILVTIELVRIPIVLTLLFVDSPNQLWLIYLSSFGLALGEAVYAPTRKATIPSLVKNDRLLHVNAIEQVVLGVVLIIGSTSGGVISYLFGMNTAFILNAMSFLISAAFLIRLSIKDEHSTCFTKPVKDVPYKLFFKSPALFIFIFICFTMPIANGIDNVLLSIYALEVFEMGDLGVGLIYGSLGVGLVLSSFFSNWMKGKLIPVIIIFIALEGVGHIFLSLSPTFLLALLSILFITFSAGLSNISIDTLIMKTVPQSKQGTFFGLTEMISNVTLGIFIAIGGLLLEIFEPRTLGAVVGVLYMCLTIIYGLMFKRVNLIKEKRNLKKMVG